MWKKALLAAAVCAVAVAGGMSAAFAGEVKGPPGTGPVGTAPNTNTTAAPSHANSICAFSGQNDFDPARPPNDFHVQSPGQDVRNGGEPDAPDHEPQTEEDLVALMKETFDAREVED